MLVAALGEGDRAAAAYRRWRQHLDWQTLPDRWHRLLPLLHARLVQRSEDDPLAERIKGLRRYIWAKNLKLISLAASVLREFERVGIDVVPLKGTSLLASGIADRSTRPMNDIDMLIRDDQVDQAIAVLADLGIHPRFTTGASLSGKLLPDRALSGWPFMNAAQQEVDIHWNAMHFDRRPDSDRELWRNTRPVQFEGISTRILAPEDQLINVCAHGARDSEPTSLRSIVDAALVLQHAGKIDWQIVTARALQHRVSAVMANAVDLLKTLLDLPIPAGAVHDLRRQSTRRERTELRILKRPPDRWRQGLSGSFIKLQEFRRGRADLFNASAMRVAAARLVEETGTNNLPQALRRVLYRRLGQPAKWRDYLIYDGQVALPRPEQLPGLSDLRDIGSAVTEGMFVHGWSIAEVSGRWSDGYQAILGIRLDHPTTKLPALSLTFVPALTDKHTEFNLSVFFNDRLTATRRLVFGRDGQTEMLCVGPELPEPTSTLLVTLEIDNPLQPGRHSGGAPDWRRLGILLSGVRVVVA
ncbi:nucleotidyltransferase family protein [Bradyrhizobium sp.]|uniref:nucleotidyltransferase domain-containing protein n=1 Tax=Bradyrhizobium sp. TaxID=376 RepID=UPI0039E56992